MKTPAWFREQIATHGGLILAEETTEQEAIQAVRDRALDTHPEFVTAIFDEHTAKELRAWMSKRATSDATTVEIGQTELFPDLPRVLEISPGRFAAQAVMTRKDWDRAAKQARTKAANADGYAEKVERARDQVVPLLTDDSMTTADVWPQQVAPELFAIGGES